MILLQWGSQGCSTRLVEMEQQRLLASAQSSTATCVLAVANTQSRKEQQALPFLDASLGLHLRNKREGEGPWVRQGTRVLGNKSHYLPTPSPLLASPASCLVSRALPSPRPGCEWPRGGSQGPRQRWSPRWALKPSLILSRLCSRARNDSHSLSRGSQAPRRAVCETRGSLRTMHVGGSAPSCCAFTHRASV